MCVEGLGGLVGGDRAGQGKKGIPKGSNRRLITSKDLMQQEITLRIWGARFLTVREEEN